MKKKKIVIAVGGASGALYAKILLNKLIGLSDQIENIGLVMSTNAKDIWEFEIGDKSY
ncbi:MAG: 3-octaprenyl-4-hydroxybenzoate carboxy-lyase, partial [Flavobacteriales bacterium]|nr:3-octaprenyl-4-hydroxybenzoate carboxy-lyase [Flavobacteriales bacterium]